MPTLTIRSVSSEIVRSLKALAKRRCHSMEQEVREMFEVHVSERSSILDQIQASWSHQTRLPSAEEVDSWIAAGRS
jgi:plasmid stability protein